VFLIFLKFSYFRPRIWLFSCTFKNRKVFRIIISEHFPDTKVDVELDFTQIRGLKFQLIPVNSHYFFIHQETMIFFQLRDTDDDLGTGSRVLSVMIMRVQRSRIVLILVALAIIITIVVSIYLSFTA
jgi:hypothetical protein